MWNKFILLQTLGDDVSTAKSYQTLSQWLLRRRLADAAVLFANSAVLVLMRIGERTDEAELQLAKARKGQRGKTQLEVVQTNDKSGPGNEVSLTEKPSSYFQLDKWNESASKILYLVLDIERCPSRVFDPGYC